jgi:hypothetical protein
LLRMGISLWNLFDICLFIASLSLTFAITGIPLNSVYIIAIGLLWLIESSYKPKMFVGLSPVPCLYSMWIIFSVTTVMKLKHVPFGTRNCWWGPAAIYPTDWHASLLLPEIALNQVRNLCMRWH